MSTFKVNSQVKNSNQTADINANLTVGNSV